MLLAFLQEGVTHDKRRETRRLKALNAFDDLIASIEMVHRKCTHMYATSSEEQDTDTMKSINPTILAPVYFLTM